jgi:glyoxylase-like metal-dependent hydrolase (beta-lactamase superfamily II)
MNSRLYFRQLLSGRDLAHGDLVAHQLMNLVYLIGDRTTGQAVIVDPAHDIDGILQALDEDGMHPAGVLATHHHGDHVGGELLPGMQISGVAELLTRVDVPVHVQRDEAVLMVEHADIGATELVVHTHGDVVPVGGIDIHLVHTPGHTPGSQCFLVEDCLLTGDTLFVDGCGHTELPGGDPAAFYDSLMSRLAPVPDDTTMYPGHLRATRTQARMGDVRRTNFVYSPRTEEEWLTLFGPGGCDGARPVSLYEQLRIHS